MNAVSSGYTQNKIHAHKLALWVGIATIIMLFGAFTSAYIVRRAAGNWYEFKLPDIFFYNTLVILASSVTMHLAFRSFKKGLEKPYKYLLFATFFLGIVFVILQYQGWEAMTAMGATFTANPSSSFVYVISGVHAAHVLGGIAALVVAMAHGFILPFKPTPRRVLRLELVANYWHFVDILWVYLVVFFMIQS